MQKFDFEKKKTSIGIEPLPAGGYVVRIMDAKIINYTWGDVLNISFDIAEGEHKDYFSKQYNENTNEDKKWKGNYRLTIPQESNQYYESQKKTFGNVIACLEESNNGYTWDWDETKLKGKFIGVLFRNEEWEYNEKTGWASRACAVTSVNDIRENKFRVPKDKPLKKKPEEKNVDSFIPAEISEDLPF